ncbi:MAG: zinc-dependent peptidase [Cyclobacteriaceae bacterium]|nr:zinc-dependent peptidase [Cyclobacteriaceae bacterium]
MGILLGVILVGIIALGVLSIFYDIGKYLYYEYVRMVAVMKPLTLKRKGILKKYFFYYNQLSLSNQKKFEKRVNRFLHSKKFVGRGIEVTEEMKVLISASAVKITFGLPMLHLSNFWKIAIYPDAYYSGLNKRYHYGEVNPRMGIILLSWKNFVDGYIDHDDNRNLGIHEMAHALHFENMIRNDEYEFLDPYLLNKWDNLAAIELENVKNNPDHFLRPYASTNEYEFFAVSMEHFFESPREYRDKLPQLYDVKSKLIRQDPIALYKL